MSVGQASTSTVFSSVLNGQFSAMDPEFRRVGINYIPNEILTLIFRSWTRGSSSSSSQLGAAEILSQVSFQWRQLAQTTPALWTDLNLNICGADEEELLTKWFSRSRAVDVFLRVDPLRQQERRSPKNSNVLETVCRHSHLWRKFRLSAPWNGLINFFAMGNLQVPKLEELVFELDSNILAAAVMYQYLTVNVGRTMFKNCTQLKSVRLALIPTFPLELLRNLLPWKNLTEVIVQKPGVHPTLVEYILTHCAGLVRLKIWTAYWRNLGFSMEYAGDKYHLENLTLFELETDVEAFVYILRSVRLPALKSLSLSRISNEGEARYPAQLTPGMALTELQEHSKFDLFHLKLCGWMNAGGLVADDVFYLSARNVSIDEYSQ